MKAVVHTIEKLEDVLGSAGYLSAIPVEDLLFGGGDGDVVEEAPTGYYRFHYWKTETQPRDHENWLAVTKEAGPICISMIRGEATSADENIVGYYRLLIRTIFGYKSLILTDDVLRGILGPGAAPTSHQLLTIALHHFVGNEKEKMILFDSDGASMMGDRASVHSAMTSMSTRTDRTRFLPHSRLRSLMSSPDRTPPSSPQAKSDLQDARRNSIRRTSKTASPLAAIPEVVQSSSKSTHESSHMAPPSIIDQSLQEKFGQFAKMKPSEVARQFQKIEDSSLSQTLLSMEQSLMPGRVEVDLVLGEDIAESTKELIIGMLGPKVDREHVIRQNLKAGRANDKSKGDPLQSKVAHLSPEEAAKAQLHPLRDLLEKERNYSRQLDAMEQTFVHELAGKNLVDGYVRHTLFGHIPRLAKHHRQLLADLEEVGEESAIVTAQALYNWLTGGAGVREAYQQYCTTQSNRESMLKESTRDNPGFATYCEQVYASKIFGLVKLDSLLMAPVQRVTRYCLHLEEITRSTHPEDPAYPILRAAHRAASAFACWVDAVSEQQRGLSQLLAMSQSVYSLPPGFASASAGRSLIGRVDCDGGWSVILLTDCLILANRSKETKKREKRAAKDKKGGKIPSDNGYDYICGAALNCWRLSCSSNTIEISLISSKGLLAPYTQEQTLWRTACKSSEEARQFAADFDALQSLAQSQTSSAQVYDTSPDIRFHLYSSPQAYTDATAKKHSVAIMAIGSTIPAISELSVPAVGLLQCKASSFRWILRHRGLLVASPHCYQPSRDFADALTIRRSFIPSLTSCGRLLAMYPPFDPAITKQRSSQLTAIASSYGDSLKYRFKSSFSRFKSSATQKSKKTLDADSIAQRIWDDSISVLALSIDDKDEDGSVPRAVHPELEVDIAPKNIFSSPLGRKTSTSKPAPSALRSSPLKNPFCYED